MRRANQRGYSLPELLTVVAIMGILSLITLPAFNKLMPQYRIRSAASEIAASLRMLRSQAVSTRNQFRMTLDPANERYTMAQQNAAGTWIPILETGRPTPNGDIRWKNLNRVDLMGGAVYTVILTRNGTPSAATSVILGVDNTSVAFNRYTVEVQGSGNVKITPSKVP
ncbi:MAG TPA: GspH/FimT family pseudopilin [Thermoanaerobaculia bacterium]|nr:GspH/FimT family pseudopilin [Thermoanaerobaculia bacterium]